MEDAAQIGAGNIERFRFLRADGEIDRIELLVATATTKYRVRLLRRTGSHAAPPQKIEPALDDVFLEFERRDAIDEQTARRGLTLQKS